MSFDFQSVVLFFITAILMIVSLGVGIFYLLRGIISGKDKKTV